MSTDSPETTVLCRPAGAAELALIKASGFAAFAPRLPHQLPAEEMDEFNRNLIGPVEVIAELRGERAES